MAPSLVFLLVIRSTQGRRLTNLQLMNIPPVSLGLTIFSLLVSVYGASTADGAVIYTQNFLTPTTSPAPLRNYDWNMNYGSGATVYNTAATTNYTVAGNPGSDGANGYLSGGTTLTLGSPVLLWTNVGTFGAINDLTSITFALKNTSTSENIRTALQIGGNWYVTNTFYNSNSFATLTMTPSLTTWSGLTFTSGSSLALGSTTALPSSGAISAIGFFDAAQVNIIRLDTVVVNSVPEPSVCGLILLSGMAWGAWSRSRKADRSCFA